MFPALGGHVNGVLPLGTSVVLAYVCWSRGQLVGAGALAYWYHGRKRQAATRAVDMYPFE